jgi:hypothetical protein
MPALKRLALVKSGSFLVRDTSVKIINKGEKI